MADLKVVSMLQEESVQQPIDYRDVVQSYETADQIPLFIKGPIRRVVENLQVDRQLGEKAKERILERIDLGDLAAENEITGLRSYFVRTGQFTQAKQGNARLIVGRKGSGKTALFYAVRDSLFGSYSQMILDLKPEGHQVTKLRDLVLSELAPGLQEHTMSACWNYILLSELAHKIVEREAAFSQRDPERFERYERLKELYTSYEPKTYEDFSQRLLHQVDNLIDRADKEKDLLKNGSVTEIIYQGNLRKLGEAVCDYLKEKDSVWLLIDNLDKGWPTKGTQPVDILVIRSFLEATRKLQRQIEQRGVDFKCLVFVRTDIYDHLIRETPDKGKDTPISLDWDDPEVFRKILQKRIEASTELSGEFQQNWNTIFDSHVGAQDSFSYMLDRTLMRPRDILKFVQEAIQVAVNRNHIRVTEEDILQAEKSYSEDLRLITGFEIGDTRPEYEDVIYAFHGRPQALNKTTVSSLLEQSGAIPADEIEAAIELLLWYGFLGVTRSDADDARYSFQIRYNLRHLTHALSQGGGRLASDPFSVLRCARSARLVGISFVECYEGQNKTVQGNDCKLHLL